MAGKRRRATDACGTRLRSGARTGAVGAALVAVGGALGACASPAAPAFDPVTLRAVESSTPGSCALDPLVSDQAGSTCDASGGRTYALGESLGDVQVVEATVDGSQLQIRVDERGRSTLADVTGRLVGQKMALVVDGVVLGAPTPAEPLETAQLALEAQSSAEAAAWLDLLHASGEG